MHLREKYGEIYTWAKECRRFEQMIHGLIQRPCRAVPSSCVLTGLLLYILLIPDTYYNLNSRIINPFGGGGGQKKCQIVVPARLKVLYVIKD